MSIVRHYSKTLSHSAFVLLIFYCLLHIHSVSGQEINVLKPQQLQSIGKKIYQNETGSNPNYLVAWNEGESFASLGLGHFIWFPKSLDSPFTETFPDLLHYLKTQGTSIPAWLEDYEDCPWGDKLAFEKAKNTAQMTELKALMLNTFSHQVNFIYQRMQAALPLMLEKVSDHESRERVTQRFQQMAASELGIYSLIDYVNFKGEGVSETERYLGEGWGLLQVLMNIDTHNKSINQAFSDACKKVLSRRVKNSPQKEVEQKWLLGWRNRCATYAL